MSDLVKRATEFYALRKSWLGEGGKPVPPDHAQRRADVCLTCPNNQEKPIYEIFAGTIANTVIRQLRLKDEMALRVRREECLHVCSVCLCILKLKVHTPLKFILESTSLEGLHEQNPRCWILTEKENLQNLQDHDNKSDRLPK